MRDPIRHEAGQVLHTAGWLIPAAFAAAALAAVSLGEPEPPARSMPVLATAGPFVEAPPPSTALQPVAASDAAAAEPTEHIQAF